jgi:flavin reductase (DIM6/NTAB) family NADH-FMN oxidoreductase RutF
MGSGFANVTRNLDYPMFVVTTSDGDERSGCLVGFATQCSIQPPRLLVFLSDKNHTYRVARRAEALAVHLLGDDQIELSALFGEETGDQIDKFDRCRWRAGPLDMPVLEDAAGWVVGRIVDHVDVGGDHLGFVLDPEAADMPRPVPLLHFQQVTDLDPGHDA